MRGFKALFVLGLAAAFVTACGGGGSNNDGPSGNWTISGRITGSAVERVLMTLGGDGFAQTETDTFGSYYFPPIPPGTYSVTPLLENVTFVPPNRIIQIIDGDIPNVDFVSSGTPPSLDNTPPLDPVRLVFAHPLEGTNWLNTNDGALGNTLGTNNYYVRDVSLGWSAPQNPNIGSQTDIGQWYTWFVDTTVQGNGLPVNQNITTALYTTNQQTASYTSIADPGGTNDVILIMASFLNSAVKSDNGQPATALFGQTAASTAHTLPNCQEVYRQVLTYFKTQPNKLFVVITAPPMVSSASLLTDAANARTLNDWLVNSWLTEGGWDRRNVAVFDFFNVLTDVDNHHWFQSGVITHINFNGDDFSEYGQGGDSTPTQTGNLRGTAEFLDLLNIAYNRWQTWLTP